MKNVFPFSAIVGQDLLKTGLLACAVNPAIGGILIRGDKGTAKSTAARGLASVLPLIERTIGCAFNCTDTNLAEGCCVCNASEAKREHTPVPFVNLPLGATEDRVIGSLDFQQALKTGTRSFQPGLLASAHRGILYIDEVNLLPDHLVDALLDVAASGVNSIEREGIAFAHPASFALVGTMNLEEGDLRPQLLDRFGLMVEVSAPNEPSARAEIVRRRLSFEQSSSEFYSLWQEQQDELRRSIVEAQRLLPQVVLAEELLLFISTMCCQLQVKSLRADMVINKTARTLAALDGRNAVTLEDIAAAAKLALPHRCRTKPGEQSSLNKEQLEDLLKQFQQEHEESSNSDPSNPEEDLSTNAADDQRLEVHAASKAAAARKITVHGAQAAPTSGRRSTGSATARGAYVRAVKASAGAEGSVAIDATVRHSVLRNNGKLNVEAEDVHLKQRTTKAANTVVFAVDASGSMSAMKRMSAVKGAVMSLLDDAYQCRDTVGVITFRGQDAHLVLPPTRSTDLARQQLEALPTGGTTPLAHALELAFATMHKSQASGQLPLLILLTDGKTNVPIDENGDPWSDALAACQRIKQQGIATVVVDTESGFVLLGQASSLAEAMGGEYVKLDELTTESLKLTVKSRLKVRTN